MEKLQTAVPNEIREIIVGLLDKGDLISIAGVSQYSRKCLLPRLFETVRLRFRFPERSFAGDENEDEGSSLNRAAILHRRAKEVLERMAEPRCGGLDVTPFVRELRIMVVDGMDAYCSQRLLLALKRLHGLEQFSWSGRTIPERVIQHLATSSRRCHISLNMAYEPTMQNSEGVGISEAIELSRDIREITLVDERQEYDTCYGNFGKDAARVLLEKLWGPLRKLALCSSAASILNDEVQSLGIPQSLTNLTHLVIGLEGTRAYEDDRWHGVKVLLQSASALESLTLLNASSLHFLLLGNDDLPRLKELKIGIERFFEISHETPDMKKSARIIHDFVLAHKNLRRFDFMLWITWQDECRRNDFQKNAEWFSLIIDAVCSLEHLTALGLTFPGLLERDMQAAVNRIIGHEQLRRSCRALRLGSLTDIQMRISLTGFSKCSFFATSNGRPRENTKSRYAPPSVEQLVSIQTDSRFEQVCLNGRVYDVLTASTDETEVIAKRWDNGRVWNREESDFCSSDGYWLMKYRDISAFNEVAKSFEDDEWDESFLSD